MTLVTIDLKSVGSGTYPTDKVIFYSPVYREAPGGGVVSTAEFPVYLVNGVGSRELVPGPVTVVFQCKGIADTSPKQGVVPEVGPVDLFDVIRESATYTPPVIAAAQSARQAAEDAADRAKASEQIATDKASQASTAADVAVTNATNAAQSSSDASASAQDAQASASSASSDANVAGDAAYESAGYLATWQNRGSITWSYEGTGTPVPESFPGIKVGDYIVRKSDKQEWRVDA